MQLLTDAQKAAFEAVYKDFESRAGNLPDFAKGHCKIRQRDGSLVPLKFNATQKYVHEQLEKQRQETGKVRAVILKGRQQGVSTYVAARFYHKVVHNIGLRCMILTHLEAASANLFGLARRYHDNMPNEIKVQASLDSAKELYFKGLDSGYKVGTAGNKNVGRSDTIQLLHASEVAFWNNDTDVVLAALQAVPNVEGSEIIMESTANGIGNVYHQYAMEAMNGDSEWQLIFAPWYWEKSNQFKRDSILYDLDDEERMLKDECGVHFNQLHWRRRKIKELGSIERFRQEYPSNPMEAFQASGTSFIPASMVAQAMERKPHGDTMHQMILGVDPAGMGEDETAFVWRRGRDVVNIESYKHMDIESIVGRIVRDLKENPELGHVCIDGYNMGYAVVEQLEKMGYQDRVTSVLVGKKSWEPHRFFNIKAQLWYEMKDWLVDAYLPKHDLLMQHLCTTGIEVKNKADGSIVMQMQSKAELADSPDLADALALTFASIDNYVTMPQDYSYNTTPTHNHWLDY